MSLICHRRSSNYQQVANFLPLEISMILALRTAIATGNEARVVLSVSPMDCMDNDVLGMQVMEMESSRIPGNQRL